ncbi:MAG: monooxygenase [Rhodobacteraceae bacterium]|nr:MAG: monooxygenase [Paracoccaceae bacterium]
MKITIAGAGIAGLAAARALASHGHDVRVCEKSPVISEVGAGLQVSPNGYAVIRALGLADALDAVSIGAETVRLIDGPSGRGLATLDLTRQASDMGWRFVHRARLIDVLKAGAEEAGATLEVDAAISPPPAGAALDGDDLLIGADGLKSEVRKRVDEASKPFFTGQVAWRALAPDTDAEPAVEVHLGPGRHLVSYPLQDGLRNIVAVEERGAWADEGWSHPDHPANLKGAFARFSPRVRGWLDHVQDVHLWGLFRHRVADRWFSGHQVLIGDAAHPTLPFLAQGANMALEDAWVLAASLENEKLATGLSHYQNLRRPRVSRVVDAATANARNYHLSNPLMRTLAHTGLRAIGTLAPARILGRFDWLYGFDVTRP